MKHNRFAILRKFVGKRKVVDLKISIYLVILLGGISIFTTLVSLVLPYLYSVLIDRVMIEKNILLLDELIFSMIVVYLFEATLKIISARVSIEFLRKTNISVRAIFINRLIKKDLVKITDLDIGKTQKLLEQDSLIVGNFFIKQIKDSGCALVFAILYMWLMFTISKNLAVVSTFLIPVTLFCGQKIGKKLNTYQNERWEVVSENTSFLIDTIQKWREIKVQQMEKHFTEIYAKKLLLEKSINLKWMRYYALVGISYEFKNKFAQNILLYFLGGMLIIKGHITIGALIMFIKYMEGFSKQIDVLIDSMTELESSKAVYKRVFYFLDEKEEQKTYCYLSKSDIEIENLDFSYQSTLQPVLKNIKYKFEYGKKYLIVGKSGEGKSTLIKLILNILVPVNGEIKFGGIPLNDIRQKSMFEKLGVIMQENYFFNLTIIENFQIVNPKVTKDDIEQVCEQIGIADFINGLPNRYDTIIGEHGVKLSGGQKQCLAIARMILHKPEIIILDEATSSLDAVSEEKIFKQLDILLKNKTMIVISHKEVLSINFDKKVFVKNQTLSSK